MGRENKQELCLGAETVMHRSATHLGRSCTNLNFPVEVHGAHGSAASKLRHARHVSLSHLQQRKYKMTTISLQIKNKKWSKIAEQ